MRIDASTIVELMQMGINKIDADSKKNIVSYLGQLPNKAELAALKNELQELMPHGVDVFEAKSV